MCAKIAFGDRINNVTFTHLEQQYWRGGVGAEGFVIIIFHSFFQFSEVKFILLHVLSATALNSFNSIRVL